jgi:RHS repeat-associated protein
LNQADATLATLAYNGLGDRLVENSTHFVMDLNAGLTQALQDGTNTYLYGNERIAQHTGSEANYFLGDALGSVRQLADGTGAVTLTKEYEPYGEVATSAGEETSAYGFTNEYTDSSVKMLYLRSRYYSLYLNQFIQADTIIPNSRNPMEWNKYLYSWDNPINLSDPSGHYPVFNPVLDPLWRGAVGIGHGPKAQYINERYKLGDNWVQYKEWASHHGTEYVANYNLCGQVSIAAILASMDPLITVFDVLDAYEDKIAKLNNQVTYLAAGVPETGAENSLTTFIRTAYPNYLHIEGSGVNYFLKKGTLWQTSEGRKELIQTMQEHLSIGHVFIVGVLISSVSGKVDYQSSVKHWVVLTGITENFDFDHPTYVHPKERTDIGYTDYVSDDNWARIYNPFTNETEYYPWSVFSLSWVADGNSMGAVTRLFHPKPLPPKDCRR